MQTKARRTGKSPLYLTAAALLGLAGGAGAQQVERFTIQGDRVAIYNLVGSIRVEGSTNGDVAIELTRQGADAARLRIERGPIGQAQTLRVVFPSDEIGYSAMSARSRTTLRVRRDGTFGDGDGGDRVTIRSSGDLQAHADMVVRVPRGRTVAVYLGVGRADVTNVDGALRVDVAAASISTENTSGVLSLDTGSGSVRARRARGRISIDTGSGRVDVADVNGDQLLIDTGSGRVTASDITVSALTIDTGSGSVEVERLSARRIEIDTGSGSVEVGVLTGVERLVVDTGSGDVTVAAREGSHRVQNMELETGSGSIRVSGLAAEQARLETGSGSVDLRLANVVRDVSISTGSGNVVLRVPSDINAELDIDANGGIEVGLPVSFIERSRSHLRGRLGSGGGRIEVDTGSGGVRIVAM